MREKIIQEAKSWLGTKYQRGARIKGARCDCATYIAEVCIALGLIPNFEIPTESAAHFIAKGDPRYLETVLRYCDEISEADVLPGDLVMYKYRLFTIFTHAAIVVNWPTVIHAVQNHGVIMGDGTQGQFRSWERKAFRLKGLV